MAAYRRVYDSHHLQADCQEPGLAPEPYATFTPFLHVFVIKAVCFSLILSPTTRQSYISDSVPLSTCCHFVDQFEYTFFRVAYSWLLCANMTSSIKPEVNNVSQRGRRETERRPEVTCRNTWRRSACSSGDILADTQTNTHALYC